MVETNRRSGTKGEADDADGDGAEVKDGQPGFHPDSHGPHREAPRQQTKRKEGQCRNDVTM